MLSSVLLLTGCSPEVEVTQTTKVTPVAEPSKVESEDTVVPSDSTAEESDASAKGVLNSAIAKAKAADKRLFVHFGAKW